MQLVVCLSTGLCVSDHRAHAAGHTAIKNGRFSKEELATLENAAKEYAERHGLSTTNLE
jgi:hypothetical protein